MGMNKRYSWETNRHVLLTPVEELIPLPTHAACTTPSIPGECISLLATHPLFSISSKSSGQFDPSEVGQRPHRSPTSAQQAVSQCAEMHMLA